MDLYKAFYLHCLMFLQEGSPETDIVAKQQRSGQYRHEGADPCREKKIIIPGFLG